MRKTVHIGILILAFVVNATAQDWNWGANESKAKQQWSLLEQKMIESDYEKAQAPCSWLLQNAPEISENLYIDASKVYENMVKIRTKELGKNDPEVKALQDTALMIYDQRIQYFGNEAYVLDRKGIVAYKYLAQREGGLDNLYGLYTKIIALNASQITAVNLTNFMKVGILKHKGNELSKQEVLQLYLKLQDLIAQEASVYKAEGKSVKTLDKNKTKIDETFSKYVTLDCQDIHTAYGEKFDKEQTVDLAKKIFSAMSGQDCSSDELFIKATVFLLEKAPEYKYFQVLSSVYFNEQKLEASYQMYADGLAFTTDSVQQSKAYFSMAQIGQIQNKYAQARADAQKSIAFGTENAAAYNLIGALYQNSYASCKSENPIATKAIFIAAYEMYAMAGNTASMAEMRKLFPTVSEMFMQNLKEGDTIKVDCWINRNVTLKKQ